MKAMRCPRSALRGCLVNNDLRARRGQRMRIEVVLLAVDALVGGHDRPKGRSVLSVISAWGTRSSHRLTGKLGWQVQKMEIRWFLTSRMALSARLARWLCGGTICTSRLLAAMKAFNAVLTSLSIRCTLSRDGPVRSGEGSMCT